MPTPQVWPAGTPIFVQSDRDLRHAHFRESRLHHHFRGEFHSRGVELHSIECIPLERAQAAVEIVCRTFEKQAAKKCQHRVSNPAMLPWHRAFHDPPLSPRHPATHHQVVSGFQLLHEGCDTAEIVAVIGVADNNPLTSRRGYAAAQRAAVTSL